MITTQSNLEQVGKEYDVQSELPRDEGMPAIKARTLTGVIVRGSPNGASLGTLPKGTLVNVNAIYLGWALIDEPAHGWVYAVNLGRQ